MPLGRNWFEGLFGRGPGLWPNLITQAQVNGLVTGKPPNRVMALTPLDD
jgi:hypothetical protein